MNLDIEKQLRVLRVRIDALGESLEVALATLPADVQAAVRVRWEEDNAQPIRRASVLSGEGGPRPWFKIWDPAQGYYWRRLRSYLIDKLNRPEKVVASIDDSSDRVLSQIENPRPDGPEQFRVQGLVVGYVQSGKTANYSALIAKAADAGYKIVIVLSGIHNSLRQQTQRRLELELGLRPGEGVGQPEQGKRWISLTRSDLAGDFLPGTTNVNILQGNEHVLLVVKKNKTVLDRLITWMGGAPSDVPVLIIDDEADQASINTGGNRTSEENQELADFAEDDDDDEIRPSTINRLIRKLINAFDRVSYVAYTATPFANVFIHHEATDRVVMDDLYPRDFIVALPYPAQYVGAAALFGRDALINESDPRPGLDVIESVPDTDIVQIIPPSKKADTFQPSMPDSLRMALLDFVLAVAGRLERHGEQPASMLIHTHHRTVIQNKLADLVREHVTELRQRWRYDRATIEPDLKSRWNKRFRPVTASIDVNNERSFDAIRDHLDRFFKDPITVLVVNSTSDDILDYDATPNLKAILVGGNRLSRGLTLEGLLVSYFVRESPYFDTLLQMGRWFGYRQPYVDLTRLWTTRQMAGWFRALALAEDELRQEIALYEAENRTPRDFGPRVRCHPAMLITAGNKMGAARPVQQSYAGQLLQTHLFKLADRAWLEQNLAVTRQFLSALGEPDSSKGSSPTWSKISWDEVCAFLDGYQTYPSIRSPSAQQMATYIRKQIDHGELLTWTVSVRCQSKTDPELGTEDLSIEGYPAVNTISRSRRVKEPDSIGSLISPASHGSNSGDELLGLSELQIAEAKAYVDAHPEVRFGTALRQKRNRGEGLLLLYPISRRSKPKPGQGSKESDRIELFQDPDRDGVTIIGMAIVFPASNSAASIEYYVGSAGDFSADKWS
jgi:hypothetical protein